MRNRRLLNIPILAAAAWALVLLGACGDGSYGDSNGAGGIQGGGNNTGGADLRLVARDNKFDKNSLTASANTRVTLTLDNKDEGVSHNLALYQGKDAADLIFRGDFNLGPGNKDYTFQTPGAGEYYFRCDVHPDTMNGMLTVR